VTPALLERPPAPLFRDAGAPTLDDLVTGAWQELSAGRPTGCPLCGGPMAPRDGEGRCSTCHSGLR